MAIIYVKGRRDPINVRQQTALEIRAAWLNKNNPRDMPIGIGGTWAGTLSEIRGIETDDDREVNRKWKEQTWSDAELEQFHKDTEQYRAIAEKRLGPGKVHYWDEVYLDAKGAVRMTKTPNGHFSITVLNATLYADLSQKVEALRGWRARHGIGLVSREAELEVVAAQQKLFDDKKV